MVILGWWRNYFTQVICHHMFHVHTIIYRQPVVRLSSINMLHTDNFKTFSLTGKKVKSSLTHKWLLKSYGNVIAWSSLCSEILNIFMIVVQCKCLNIGLFASSSQQPSGLCNETSIQISQVSMIFLLETYQDPSQNEILQIWNMISI